MLAELDQAEHALAAFPGEFFRVDSFLIRASGLWERAKRREAARVARAARVKGGQGRRGLHHERDARICAAHARLAEEGKASSAAEILSKREGLSARQIRRIVKG
jgi:hypothetical protein